VFLELYNFIMQIPDFKVDVLIRFVVFPELSIEINFPEISNKLISKISSETIFIISAVYSC